MTVTIIPICENRKARFDYDIEETVEAGLALTGSEVKACRSGEASLSDAYALPRNGNMELLNAHIGAYKPASVFAHLPTRVRRVLLKKSEIDKWSAKVRERGYSIVPLSMYFKDGWAKVSLGLAKGKKHHDKRKAIAERETKREVDRAMRRR